METRYKQQYREDLLSIYHTALQSVVGDEAVKRALHEQGYDEPCHLIAIGKAADAMTRGAIEVLQDKVLSGIAINKTGSFTQALLAEQRIQCVEGEHPVPTEKSLQAGQALLQYIQQLPVDAECLVLFSGGASSLVEVLADGWTLGDLQELTSYLLANAYDIHAMNAVRRRLSQIKGGGLWNALGQRSVTAMLISDVQGDDPRIIGSGVLFPSEGETIPDDLPAVWQTKLPEPKSVVVGEHFNWSIIASLDIAKQAAARKAQALGYRVTVIDEFMSGDAGEQGNAVAKYLQQVSAGITIWGGETTVRLPENPGKGGRNLHLGLSAAVAIQGKPDLLVLSSSTDGVDGVTEEAGTLVDSQTILRGKQQAMDAEDYLNRADACHYLEATDDLIHTGPSGTNVMDLVIGVKLEAFNESG
jgi:hydroxypyruvate reductase